MKKKVLLIFGTRPEAIKLAPVIQRLKDAGAEMEPVVCITGQHREMLDQVLDLFNIRPDYDLKVMKKGQSLFDVTTSIIGGLEQVLKKELPDIVLVQGDTTSAFLGSLAAFYLRIPVGHVEAGLRTYDKFNPFPEEMNRVLADALTDYYFAPTETARGNLLSEKVPPERVWVTGNTVIDALLSVSSKLSEPAEQARWTDYFRTSHGLDLSESGRKLILVSGHRRESFGLDFENICNALKKIVERNKDVTLVYPVHLNPNVQQPVFGILGDAGLKNRVFLIDPIPYAPFVFLMKKAYLILTDSGGIQEEAPGLAKPVLVMRKVTERPEGIAAGTCRVVGTEIESIVGAAETLLHDREAYQAMARVENPYGDGRAAERIVGILREIL